MNERIRELELEAIAYADSKVPEYNRYNDIYYSIVRGKFAELIVQEMCSVLDKAQWDKGEDWICADGTRIIPQIKEHFGVE